MKPLKKTFLQFPSDLQALDHVLSWFEELNHQSIPLKVWLQCQLALAEGFTNAVRHAHKGLLRDVVIGIEVTLFPECLEIRIWDSGPPFDLEGRIKSLCETPDETSGSGRGIAILHKIADRLSYTRTNDQRNCLLIVKHYLEAS